MSAGKPRASDRGITLRQAALVAGIGILIMVFAGPFAELYVYAKLVVPGDIEQTTRNLTDHKGLFFSGILAYLTMFVCDLVVAWALYHLLLPTQRALSLLTASFRLVYAVIALSALSNLVVVFRLVGSPDYGTVHGLEQLHAQVRLLLGSFQYEWGMGLGLFGVHLCLLGFLVYRSGYIPRILGVLLGIAGAGWGIDSLRPYLFPQARIDFVMITMVGELIFMLWLLVRGWRIQEPLAQS